MPVVDVVNLDGKKVGEVELADAVFGAKVNPHLLHEASRWYLERAPPRHAQGQGKERSVRCRPQALEAEGHRPRACRFNPVAFVAPWRNGARTAPAQLQLCVAEKDAARRIALGAFGEAGGLEIDRGRWLATGIAQDPVAGFDAGKVELHASRLCWCRTARTATWNWPAAIWKA